MNVFWIIGGVVGIVLLFVMFLVIVNRYKRCPSDKILVIFGNVGKDKTAKCVHGGAAFIWPIIQDYAFLSLTPVQIDIPLKGALSKQQIRINIPSTFTVGVSTEPNIMPNAAERLLGLQQKEIQQVASELITGQLRQAVAMMTIEEINADREKFLSIISKNVETELEKVGLRLINVNVTDIRDESGYIDALGRNATAEAVNKANKDVAEKTKDGEIGTALAMKEQRIKVAEANATAVEGENQAKITVANSASELRQKEAEANRLATAAEKVAIAKAQEETYAAEQLAEVARANRETAAQQADIIVKAKTAKEQIEIAAEAEAEKTRRIAKGEADSTYFKMEATARGMKEILDKQAEGLTNIVKAAGGDPKQAAMLLIVDKLPELVRTQVEAIKNIKIDKVTVWDSGKGEQTPNFVAGVMKSVPALNDLLQSAGMSLPELLGKPIAEKKVEVAEK